MRRRELLAGLGAASWPSAAWAQPAPPRTYRLGALVFTSTSRDLIKTIAISRLERLGFAEGRNLALDLQLGAPTDMPRLARELVASGPDIILAIGNVAVAAVLRETATIPIIVFGSSVVELGWADSLARPGSNLTGLLMLAPELDAKRLQILHEAAPEARTLAALIQPDTPNTEPRRQAMRSIAGQLSVELVFADASGPDEYEAAFKTFRDKGARGVVIGSDPIFLRDINILAETASRAGLTTICHWREMAARGCMLSYGPLLSAMYARIAELIARILRGEKPGDIPIEQPTQFELALNQRTANSLGVTLPPTLLARVDEVIE